MTNEIHPTVVIEGDVELGDNNVIGPYSVLYGPLRMGSGNIVGPHVAIGTPGQDTRNPRYDSAMSFIDIGDGNIIREFSAIQKPCYRDVTKIGNHVFIMQSVHIPHDAVIDDDVVITPMVAMGGIVRIFRGANIAVGSSVHQYSVVGHYSIVGMGSVVTKNIRPFSKYIPGKPVEINDYAVKKFGFLDIREQIVDYLMRGIMPSDSRLVSFVNEFDQKCHESGRDIYS